MKTVRFLLVLVMLVAASGTGCHRQRAEERQVPSYAAPFDAATYGARPLFDGKTLEGWEGDPSRWQVVGGALVGTGDEQCLFTAGSYSSFRLFVSSIQVEAPNNHQGVAIWATRPSSGNFGYGKALMLMPPMPWLWDYALGREPEGEVLFSRDAEAEGFAKRGEWSQAEILVNRKTGLVRLAVNGVEVLRFRDKSPNRPESGPIGLQAHKKNHDVRYKDLYIELDPKSDELLSVER